MPITSIDNNRDILNFIEELNIKLSKPQLNHLINLMTRIINIDGKRNISRTCRVGQTNANLTAWNKAEGKTR